MRHQKVVNHVAAAPALGGPRQQCESGTVNAANGTIKGGGALYTTKLATPTASAVHITVRQRRTEEVPSGYHLWEVAACTAVLSCAMGKAFE